MRNSVRQIPTQDGGRLAFLLAIIAMLSGCSDQLPTYPVQGRVQFVGGGPVRVGTIEFKSREHGVQARGELQTDGSFSLTTYQDKDGAVAGLHDCVIVQFVMLEGVTGHRPSKLGVIAPKYNSYATSGLQVEVSPIPTNDVLIEVEGIVKSQSDAEHPH